MTNCVSFSYTEIHRKITEVHWEKWVKKNFN